jgi:hypothetical protein
MYEAETAFQVTQEQVDNRGSTLRPVQMFVNQQRQNHINT